MRYLQPSACIDTVALTTYALTETIISGYGVLPVSEAEEEPVAEETDTDTETEEPEAPEETDSPEESTDTPEGALSDNASLVVTLLDENSYEYASAAEAIGYDSESAESNMAALDITFYDEFGVEVEPAAAVTISIDITEILPEGTTAETLEVTHITDDAVNTVEPLAETVTDDTDETAVVVFETESFSTFTLTWSYNAIIVTLTETIDVDVYDEDSGELIPSTSISNITNTFSSDVEATLADICSADGYEYDYATITYTTNGQSYTVTLDTLTCTLRRYQSPPLSPSTNTKPTKPLSSKTQPSGW